MKFEIAVASGMIALGCFASAVETRSGCAYGDVSLQGPLQRRFDLMFRNHVLDEDPVYLTECYKERTETSLWQTEFWGKYMHSAAPFWTMTGNGELKAKLDAGIANLLPSQQPDGYLGNYREDRRAERGTWDVWGAKYTMMGLLHYFDATGDKKSLDACCRLCDYLIKTVGPNGKLKIGETGNYAGQPSCSVLEPVMWLYNRTQEKRYLDFASFIVKEMTERESGPRLLDLARECVPVAERSKMPKRTIWTGVYTNRGKAYEMMSCYQGLIEYYEVTGRSDLYDAAVATAWDIATQEINLAGSGASHEHWYYGAVHQNEPFANTQETCVTITWMRLCEKLLAVTGDVRWADQFERSFYNAYLASMSMDGRTFAAYTPLDGTRSEGHLHCRMHTNCCNANGPRGFLSFLRSILQAKGDEVFVNYYTSSRAAIKVPALGENVIVETHTLYPKEGKVDIRLRIDKPLKFKLSVRIPDGTAGNSMSINGKPVFAGSVNPCTYVTHDRTWNPGDVITLNFGLPVKAHYLSDTVAFTRGPVLLARDSRFADGEISEELRGGAELTNAIGTFRLERSTDANEIWMTFAAELPLGGHSENPDRVKPCTVRFCDYASAGNRWRTDDAYRVWIPMMRGILSAFPKERRLDRSKLIVGSYGFGGITNVQERHVRDLADCGIDIIKYGNVKEDVLDMFDKYGVQCIRAWVMPGDWWWTGDANVKFSNGERWCKWDMDKLRRYLEKTPDSPAVSMIDVKDEPNALDFAYLGKVVDLVKRTFPEQDVFFNLFPNYALPDSAGRESAKSQLGTKDYEEHIAKYCKYIPLDYICYDFYPFAWNIKPRQFYDNLRVVADACTATGKSHWLYLQATRYNGNGKADHPILDLPRLRYQANTALAYGAECIFWACWAPSWSGWDINAVDASGNRTQVYEPLKAVNTELHRLSPDYMRFRRTATDLVGLEGELEESSSSTFRNVRASDGAALAVGHFGSRTGTGEYAMFVSAIDDPNGTKIVSHEVTFRLPLKGFKLRAVDGTGPVAVKEAADGTYSFRIETCRGVLVMAER